MTFQEALDLAKNHLLGFTPAKYAEFSTCFVFYFNKVRTMDGAISVNKKTGEVLPFRPDIIPPEEADNVKFKVIETPVQHSLNLGRTYIASIFGGA